jgi:hypothetical protein
VQIRRSCDRHPGRKAKVRRRRRSPIFALWLAIQRRGPVCARWRSFGTFYRDVSPKPSWRHLLIRTDPTAEFSPDNARWQVARWYQRRRLTHVDAAIR